MCACESVYVYFYFFITFCLCRELRLWPRKNVRSLTNTGLRPRLCSLKPPTELMQDVSKCSAWAQTRVRLTYRCAATAFPVGNAGKIMPTDHSRYFFETCAETVFCGSKHVFHRAFDLCIFRLNGAVMFGFSAGFRK